MKRNERFIQQNFYQYKNNLSPFGQKIFNVLSEKQSSRNKCNNGCDRRYGQKRMVVNFDDSSTPKPLLFGQSEESGDYDSSNPYSHDRDTTIINDCEVGDASISAQLHPIGTARKDANKKRSSFTDVSLCRFKPVQSNTYVAVPNARIFQSTSAQNNSREDVSNVSNMTAVVSCHSETVQINVMENNPNTISEECQFNPIENKFNRVRCNVSSAKINKTSECNNLSEDNTYITAGFELFNSKENNYEEDRSEFTSSESINECNSSVSSQNLLKFQPIQYIEPTDHRPNIKIVQRIAQKETVADDDGSEAFFDLGPVMDDAEEDGRNVCRLDLLKPLEFDRNIRSDKSFSDLNNKSLNILTFEQSTPIDGNQALLMEKSNILWCDMFDTELLPDEVIAPVVKDKIIAEQKAAVNHKQFKISFPKDKTKKSSKSHKTDNGIKRKPAKRKIELLNKEIVSKKLKETNVNKNKTIVKKEKYTKTVKKWLDTVNPNNLVEFGSNQKDENEDSYKTVDRKIIEDKSGPVPKKRKESGKKVVQARLINKGGVMKFEKPDIPQDSGKDDTSSDSATAEIASKPTNRVSLKRGKPKFVAPLKSQIPVKEIEFNIVGVDENNLKEHVTKLQNSNITEVYAVLTYGNSFCQLNKQFTEDDCIPDGVMLLVDEDFYYFQKSALAFSDAIIKFLENQTVVCYDGKSILIFFKHHFEMDINFCMQDVQIGGSLLEPDSPPDSFGDVQKLARATPEYSVVTLCPRQKTAWYLTLLRECAAKLKFMLEQNGLWSLFRDIEMPVLPVIAEMEFHGILVESGALQRMEGLVAARMRAVERRCAAAHITQITISTHCAAAGGPLALRSPARLAAVLYDRLQLHTRARLAVRATLATGNKSTSEDMLRMLVGLHPLPELILEYRRLHKAHATFLAGIRQHVKDGVVKPTWVQTAAATGRVASNNPNVQAIPKAPFSLTSDGDNPEEAINLRSVYVARPGHVFLAGDFRQMECRVFASVARDRVLLAALHCGRDLFTVLAAQWLKKGEEQVSAAERERTKRIVYASLYGAGVRKLMAILHVGYDQAVSILASFHNTFPSLKSFSRAVWRAQPPRTPAGRARPLPALASPRERERARARRQALNFLVQGAAADACKAAMASARAALRAAGVRARLLLQLHDELLWELPDDQLHAAHACVRASMEASGPRAGLPAPLAVVLRAGRSWGDLRQLDAY